MRTGRPLVGSPVEYNSRLKRGSSYPRWRIDGVFVLPHGNLSAFGAVRTDQDDRGPETHLRVRIQLLLGKTAMGIFFWLTFGGFGLWWLIEWFLTPKRVNDYNREMSVNLARDTKMMA